MLLVTENGPEIFRTLWKITARGNVADNFWRPGNMLAALDAESGRVERVVLGVGPEQKELDLHPETSKPLKGLILPEWDKVKDLCFRGARAFSGLHLQAWDVAICETGPVLVEINIGGDFNLPQVATGKGMMDQQFTRFLASM
ncbi:MAG: hypothetical protein L0Y39_07845, partial [Methylococcaceae bacterium]|nr:hypothetical protein [Methylococcaceae bacterium]